MILFLGGQSEIVDFLERKCFEVVMWDDKVSLNFIQTLDPKYIISYGYRHIISKEITDKFEIINLHISYLPWNRGADPNFWSFYDKTPKGVTIHLMDEGVDTGDILFQREVCFSPEENTLSATYNRLKKEMDNLFIENWESIKNKTYVKKKQDKTSGSLNKSKRLKNLWNKLPDGWETRVDKLKELL